VLYGIVSSFSSVFPLYPSVFLGAFSSRPLPPLPSFKPFLLSPHPKSGKQENDEREREREKTERKAEKKEE
jgi:hypothetical protein